MRIQESIARPPSLAERWEDRMEGPESFGRKIQQATEAQREGCKVKIISEERWKSALT